MREAGTTNMGAYLRKMALDGLVIKLELPELKQMISLLRYTSNNINQIARSVNAGIAKPEDAKRGLYLLDQVYELMFRMANK